MRISDWSSDVCSSDLPCGASDQPRRRTRPRNFRRCRHDSPCRTCGSHSVASPAPPGAARCPRAIRSEEHTSELQSLMRISYAVFCLKKKNTQKHTNQHTHTKHHIYK